MQELVDGKRIVVEHPTAGRIAPERRDADVEGAAVDESRAVTIQQEVEGDDIGDGDEIAAAGIGSRRCPPL